MKESNLPRRLDLGCGRNKLEGTLGIDKVDLSTVDVVHDLEKRPWPLPNNYFTYVRVLDVLEHIKDVLGFMEEVYRIVENEGTVEIRVPYYNSKYAWRDPTHQRAFSEQFPDYFSEDGKYKYYSEASFEVKEMKLHRSKLGRLVPGRLLTLKLSYYVCNILKSITFILKPLK